MFLLPHLLGLFVALCELLPTRASRIILRGFLFLWAFPLGMQLAEAFDTAFGVYCALSLALIAFGVPWLPHANRRWPDERFIPRAEAVGALIALGWFAWWFASSGPDGIHYGLPIAILATGMIVTGVSTGALTAPFAFLGSKYDSVLREMYTTIQTSDLVKMRPILRILYGDAAADVDGIRSKLREYVTKAVVDEIGAEHKKGRRLYIGTTNLDAQRAVVWNIGEIALSPRADRYDLVRNLMLASASIPGAFPPVLIDVEAKRCATTRISAR